MTNVLKQKNIKRFEWTVKASNYQPVVSDCFLLQDCKCHLQLKIGNWNGKYKYYDTSYLNFRSNRKLQPPVKIIVHIPSMGINQLKSITDECEELWGYSTGEDLVNVLMTYEIICFDSSRGEVFFNNIFTMGLYIYNVRNIFLILGLPSPLL